MAPDSPAAWPVEFSGDLGLLCRVHRNRENYKMKIQLSRAYVALAAMLALCTITTLGQKPPKPMSAKKLDALEQAALTAMKAKAA